jgi:hypothetical protein
MTRDTGAIAISPSFPLPSLNEQANLAEKHGIETLLFCPDSWALRHVFINQNTGEVVRARCNRWDCLYCGPRKVDQWRQLVKAAEPTLFVTLTKAGKTVEEAARALTTFLQYLRRGSKGRGPNHIGSREAYHIEYFAVLDGIETLKRTAFIGTCWSRVLISFPMKSSKRHGVLLGMEWPISCMWKRYANRM